MKQRYDRSVIVTGIIAAAVIFSVVGYLLVFLPSSGPDSQKKEDPAATLRFYYIFPENEPGHQSFQNIIHHFNLSQQKIRVEGVPGMSIDKQLVSMMSGNAPDAGHTFWPNSIRWAQNGALEPLTSYIGNTSFEIEDFLPASTTLAQYQGDVYAIPFYVQTMALFYNVDMLKAAGYENPPETMEELKAMAIKMTIVDEKGEIESMGFLPDYPWLDNVLWPILFGAEFYDPKKNEVTSTSGEYLNAIEFQNRFYQQWGWEQVSRFMLKFGSDEQEPFYQKKLAMAMGGEWVAREVKMFAPDLRYGVCPFPYPGDRPDLKNSSMISSSVIYMPSGSAHKEEAWEFIRFLTSTESMLQYANENKCLMARKSVLTNPQIKNDPDLKLLAEFALNKSTRTFPPLPIVDEYLNSLTEQTRLVFKQEKTPYEAMKTVKEKIDPLLKKVK